jgi:PAS domain S-box-containing protein
MPSSLEQQTHIILDSIADGVFTVDKEWRITSFNRAAEQITGIARAEALTRHCWEVFRTSICEQRCALRTSEENPIPPARSAGLAACRGEVSVIGLDL